MVDWLLSLDYEQRLACVSIFFGCFIGFWLSSVLLSSFVCAISESRNKKRLNKLEARFYELEKLYLASTTEPTEQEEK